MSHAFHSRKAVVAMIMILAAGIALGIVTGWAACDRFQQRRIEDFRAHLKSKFTHELRLTPDQQKALESMLDKWVDGYRATRQRHVNDILKNLDMQRKELEPLLTPEQIRLLDTLHAETVNKIKEKMR